MGSSKPAIKTSLPTPFGGGWTAAKYKSELAVTRAGIHKAFLRKKTDFFYN
jgi:hypothetical protein